MMKFSWARAAFFFAFVVATGIVACSGRPSDQGPAGSASASGGESTGTVGYELRLGRTTHINKASYTITCPGGFTKSGTIDVSKLRELEGSIPNLPPGGPCTLALVANSTNGNVSCSGTKSGLTVNCPGNRPQDETHVKMTCTRNHQGREWGDNDWKENARTFVLGAEVNLVCAAQDAGVDACIPKTSCASGQTCGTVPDGCGGTLNCGNCASGQTCNANSCGCVPITCASRNANCGAIPDGCGGLMVCGSCNAPETCGGGGIANQCGGPDGCVPTTCGAYANSHGFTLACGPLPDGCGGTLNCGSCPQQHLCFQNFCEGCLIVSCAQLGANCGTLSDGCSGTVFCGTCPSGQTCGGGGIPNQCGSAQQDAGVDACILKTSCAAGQNCGTVPDGCGGTLNCGVCTPPQSCNAGRCATGCVPLPPLVACRNNVCGTAFDGCGGIVSCGVCPSGTCTIPDGGTAGICTGCTPLCSGKNCGPDGCGGTCGTCPAGQGCSFDSPGTCAPCGVCPHGQVCGQSEDFCFNLISCGTCASGEVCISGNKCCTPQPASVTCAGKTCGSMYDNCGNPVVCGTCPAGTTCSNPGSAGTCVSNCLTSCPAGQTCGTAPDGCGGVVQCGPSCPISQACGPDGQCHPGCSVTGSTLSCLQAQDKPTSPPVSKCSSCTQSNSCLDPAFQGGTCESVAGNATLYPSTLPDGKTCAQVVGSSPVSEGAICFQTLGGIFASKCAASLQETPCLCGATDVTGCLGGTATPTGPLYDEYACDFNSTSGLTISSVTTNFTVPTFGAGMGNSIAQCAAAFGCDCF